MLEYIISTFFLLFLFVCFCALNLHDVVFTSFQEIILVLVLKQNHKVYIALLISRDKRHVELPVSSSLSKV